VVVLVDFRVSHDSAVLGAAVVVDIDDPERGRLLLVITLLSILQPLELTIGSFAAHPEDRVLIERSLVGIALLHIPLDVIFALVFMWVTRLSSLEATLVCLGLSVGNVDVPLLVLRSVLVWLASDSVGTSLENFSLRSESVSKSIINGMWF